MGIEIDAVRFEKADYDFFSAKLKSCLTALEKLTGDPTFGVGETTIGAEVELFLAEKNGTPLPLNTEIINRTSDSHLTYELNRYNIECNPDPLPLAGRPFTNLADEMKALVDEVEKASLHFNGVPVMIGILPTLEKEDFTCDALSDQPRYKALTDALHEERGEPFSIKISGKEPLFAKCDTVAYVGANTSFQLHLRVEPAAFDRYYNAALMATPPVLAISTNSPTFLGRRLWHETRIPLFKQACDERKAGSEEHARVTFGRDWQRGGVCEAFRDLADRYRTILPIVSDKDPLREVEEGKIPGLDELRLHTGTIWEWTRPVYDPTRGGHLRIELRALPAGPTIMDMVANGAFFIGLIQSLAESIEDITSTFPFESASHNFYRAAQMGPESILRWADRSGNQVESGARDLAGRLLSKAKEGLKSAGVLKEEYAPLLEVIEGRIATGRSGSVWQLETLKKLEKKMVRKEAVREMTKRYIALSREGAPVHEWPV